MTDTQKPMRGTWTLIAPDGRQWQGDHPLGCLSAELSSRVPEDVQLARIHAAIDKSDLAERHVQLGKFYSVKYADDMIDAMERHIARLQEKLAAAQPPFSFAPQRVREG